MSVRNIREAEGLLMDVHDPSKGPVYVFKLRGYTFQELELTHLEPSKGRTKKRPYHFCFTL